MIETEIKSRGKRKDNGEWVYGYFFEVGGIGKNSTKAYIIPTGKMYLCGSHKMHQFPEVIPETVGQFTGLWDCKRTEEFPRRQPIYVGDITGDGCEVRFGVFSTDDDWGTEAIGFFKTDGKSSWGLVPDDPETIIGDVYDNPELLGEQKQ